MLPTWNPARKRRPRAAGRPPVRLRLVQLEDRTVLTVYTPTQIVAAYGFNQINFGTSSAPIPGDGRGQTIAIVDAYSDPHISSDLAAFSTRFGLPQMNAGGPTFAVIDQSNGTPDPTGGNWELETALDVEWAHAVAPQANILLVEAASDYVSPTGSAPDLLAAVDTAASAPGVVAVSMSWGVREYAGELQDDLHFAAAAHPGVTFLAASGDSGAGVGYPAISPNVVSVGGTSLRLTSSGAYSGETGWGHGSWSWFFGGSGGGISRYEAKPAYQSAVTQSRTQRTNPDVAYDADPNTGVIVYDNGGYYAVGGTSAGSPQWAGLVAIADQGAALLGKAPLTGATQTLPALYAASQGDFHDITSGSNGYSAGPGYDLVTGRGTPKAPLIVNDLIRVATPAGGLGGGFNVGGGSATTTFTPVRGPTTLPPAPLHHPSLVQTGEALSPTTTSPTGLTVLSPVTTTPAGAASTATAAPLVTLPAPAFTSTAVLPPAASVTAVTAAAPALGAPTVTGLAPPAFTTSAAGNSGGSGGDTLFGPAVALPALPADGNPAAPAQDNNPAPTPAAPDGAAPAAPGGMPGLPGGVPAAESAAPGAAFGWEDGDGVTLPNSGAAVAALLTALGYCGTGQAAQPEEDERRRFGRSGFPA